MKKAIGLGLMIASVSLFSIAPALASEPGSCTLDSALEIYQYPNISMLPWGTDFSSKPTEELLSVALSIYRFWSSRLPDGLVDQQALERFVEEVQGNYFDNPYHNFIHAVDVAHSLHCMLADFKGAEEYGIDAKEALALITAALCHDLRHPGLSNTHLIETSHDYALMFNDRSVLENLHAQVTFKLLAKNNFVQSWSKIDKKKFRSIIIESILATDMACHFASVEKLEAYKNGTIKVDAEKKKRFIMEVLLHAADISNGAKPFDLFLYWSKNAAEEQFRQGDIEKALGMRVALHMDRQIADVEVNTRNFLTRVSAKLLELVSEVLPNANIMRIMLKKNLERLSGE